MCGEEPERFHCTFSQALRIGTDFRMYRWFGMLYIVAG